jgi:hypothetical protein
MRSKGTPNASQSIARDYRLRHSRDAPHDRGFSDEQRMILIDHFMRLHGFDAAFGIDLRPVDDPDNGTDHHLLEGME